MPVRPVVAAALTAVLAACSAGSSSAGAAATSTSAVSAPATQTASTASTARAAQPAAGQGPCGRAASSAYRHVIWIWLENRSYQTVLGTGSGAPHLAAYAKKCGVATNYHAITHPSLPNYLAATAGSPGGVTTDCTPQQCPQRRSSLFGQVARHGLAWRGYAESMAHNCDRGTHGKYAARHNPAVYFRPISAQCRHRDVIMGGSSGAFATALSKRALPAFAFVTPNLCNDGHDCAMSVVDGWLATWLGRITGSPAYAAGDTAVFVTWDEGIGNNHVATVVIAPTVPPGTRAGRHLTHYSLLRTTEELLNLPLMRHARGANSMAAPFHLG